MAGADSFGFFRRFLRELAPGKLHQRWFPFQFALAFDAAHQLTDFVAVHCVLRASRSTNMLYLYSEVVMLAIRLPQSIEKRLEKLARRTGRTKTYYVREAILEHLEDIEDLYLAEGALERVRSGEEQTIPLKKVMKRHGTQR
jgi:RHH-type transcriptional regulator, rel operon repressor / antitoxin RelB